MGDFTNSSGIDWNFNTLEEHISNRGTEVIHEMGIACTCRNSDPFAPLDRPRSACDQCGGFGYIYRNARSIVGLLTSIDQKRTLLMAGFAAPGDCIFSPHLGLDPSICDFDKITFTHPQPIDEGQVIVRGAAHKGENRILNTYLEKNEDRLFYEAVHSLHCEDEHGVVYDEGSDFVFEGKVIKWLNDKMLVNTRYVIKYEGHLEWIAYVSPFERRDRERDLGQRVLLRKRHIAIMANYNPKITAADKVESPASIPSAFGGVLV